MRLKKYILFPLCICFLSCLTVSAHSGKTDSNGGHIDHSTGDYHYHHGYPAHDHYDMDGDGDLDCPYNFDDKTGQNSGSHTSSNSGYSNGYADGESDGYDQGYDDGYGDGYSKGQNDERRKASQANEDKLNAAIREEQVDTFLSCVFFGAPIVAYIAYWFTKNKYTTEAQSLKAEISRLKKSVSGHTKPSADKHNTAIPSDPPLYTSTGSSLISSFEYHDNAIYITFRGGGKYCYYNVPYKVYQGLVSAPSKGKYFHQNIKNKFPCTPLG